MSPINRLSLWTAALMLISLPAQAQADIFTLGSGETDFERFCAACHGFEGRGKGPVAPFLIRTPPNLTQLTARNEGVFPENYVFWIVDGRADVKTHGTREMPVWGYEFSETATGLTLDPDAETRINNLVYYLRALQRPTEDAE